MARIVVYHRGFGCETGCCGHVIATVPDDAVIEDRWDLDDYDGEFTFSHPYRDENLKQWARNLIRDELGEEHVKDLDWENSWVIDD